MILTPPPTGGQQILRHALVRRWRSIVAGTLVGILVGVIAALALPRTHSATVTMTVTSPTPTPAPAVRASLSNTTDMVTEQGIARSANVLEPVAAALGVNAADLRSHMEVSGDTNGTIVRIEYTAPTREEAIAAADAIAAAYLTERTALVKTRADEMSAALTQRIDELSTRLSEAEQGGDTDTAQLRTQIDRLNEQIMQLTPYHVTAGQVITSGAQSTDEPAPSRARLLLIFTAVGVFAGLLLVLVRETRSRVLASPSQLADLTALPVWSAEAEAPEPWRAPTRMLAMAIDRDHWVDLIVDASDPQATALHATLSQSLVETRVPAPRLIDSRQPLASLLDEVRPSKHVLIAVRGGADLRELRALLDELALINREVNGMIYLGDANELDAPATPDAVSAPAATALPTTGEAPVTTAERSKEEQ